MPRASGIIKHRELVTLRLVPGRHTSNRTNYRLFHTLHELGELKEPFLKRISWRPLRVRESEQLWWDIILTPDTARFYITVPVGPWVDWIKSKIERMWDDVVVSLATEEDADLIRMSDSSVVSKMGLKRHNMFSLANDRREETHPIGDMLGVIDDLKEGEKIRLAIKFDPVDRILWQNSAQNAHKRFTDGKMPKRGAGSPRDLFALMFHLIFWMLGQAMEAFVAFLPGGSKYESPLTLQRDDRDRGEVLVDGRLSRATFEKANLPAFKCDCFVVAQAGDSIRGESLLTTIAGALGSEMDENNEWVRTKAEPGVIKWINTRQLRSRSIDKVVLSTKEFGKLAQLPTAGVQDQYRQQIMASEKLSLDLPACITGEGMPYGVAESRGQQVPVSFPVKNPDEVVKVSVLIGESGSGKTTAIINRALGALAAGKSIFFYDFTNRKPLDQLLNALPEPFPDDHIVCLNYGNREWPIGTAWNEVRYGIPGGHEDVLASEFWTFFSRYADDGVARTRRWMKKAALACADAGCMDPLNITLMLLSKQFREQVLARVTDPILLATWEQWDMASDRNQMTMAEPVLSRIDYLLDNRALKNCICQPPKLGPGGKPLIDFRKWADGDARGPYLVLIHVPKVVFSAAGLDAMMAWLNAKEWLMTLTRNDGLPECLIIKDEVHQIPSLAAKAEEQIVEGRKYRVGPVWAFHSLAQVEKISPSLARILRANNPNIHLLKSDEDTYRMLGNQLAPFSLEQDLLKMENHWAVNRWRVEGRDQVFMCKLHDKPPVTKDRTHLWDLHSRIYGRPKEEVATEIAAREMMLFGITEKKMMQK